MTDTNINKLTTASAIAAGDLVAIWSQAYGAEQSASLTAISAAINSLLTVGQKVTQYAAPGATGFAVVITKAETWLVLTPLAAYAAGTITLPTGVDRAEVLVNTTQTVTALTINGGTVSGGPTTLAAGGFFRLRYDGVLAIWYRVG